MSYAQYNFDFKAFDLSESDFHISKFNPAFDLYYSSVRNRAYNKLLHHLHKLPKYLIKEILKQPNLDFSIKDSENKTPIDVLLENFDGKQFVTIIT